MTRNGITININPKLKKEFKLSCVEKNETMSEAIINFIANYIQKKEIRKKEN